MSAIGQPHGIERLRLGTDAGCTLPVQLHRAQCECLCDGPVPGRDTPLAIAPMLPSVMSSQSTGSEYRYSSQYFTMGWAAAFSFFSPFFFPNSLHRPFPTASTLPAVDSSIASLFVPRVSSRWAGSPSAVGVVAATTPAPASATTGTLPSGEMPSTDAEPVAPAIRAPWPHQRAGKFASKASEIPLQLGLSLASSAQLVISAGCAPKPGQHTRPMLGLGGTTCIGTLSPSGFCGPGKWPGDIHRIRPGRRCSGEYVHITR
jgi:hypothetical protein